MTSATCLSLAAPPTRLHDLRCIDGSHSSVTTFFQQTFDPPAASSTFGASLLVDFSAPSSHFGPSNRPRAPCRFLDWRVLMLLPPRSPFRKTRLQRSANQHDMADETSATRCATHTARLARSESGLVLSWRIRVFQFPRPGRCAVFRCHRRAGRAGPREWRRIHVCRRSSNCPAIVPSRSVELWMLSGTFWPVTSTTDQPFLLVADLPG